MIEHRHPTILRAYEADFGETLHDRDAFDRPALRPIWKTGRTPVAIGRMRLLTSTGETLLKPVAGWQSPLVRPNAEALFANIHLGIWRDRHRQ